MISLSLFNFIKNILNIQDNNISFPEEDYCQIIEKGDSLIKSTKRTAFGYSNLNNLKKRVLIETGIISIK